MRDVVVVIDGAQLSAHKQIDISSLGCDFFACSGHKVFVPTGIGALIAKRSLLEEAPPFITGGNMIMEVRCEKSTFKSGPEKYEAGTPHIAGAIGFSAALAWIVEAGIADTAAHEHELIAHAYEELRRIPQVEIYGDALHNKSGGALPFNVRGAHAHDVGSILDQEGVAVRAGHHCTQPFHRALGIDSSVRASFHVYNQHSDVERLIKGVKRAVKIFH